MRRHTVEGQNPAIDNIDEFFGADVWVHEPCCSCFSTNEVGSFLDIEDVVSVVDRLRADHQLRYVGHWVADLFDHEMAIDQIARIEEIWRECLMLSLGRVAIDVVVTEKALFRRLSISTA
jgi:hypothetical protein